MIHPFGSGLFRAHVFPSKGHQNHLTDGWLLVALASKIRYIAQTALHSRTGICHPLTFQKCHVHLVPLLTPPIIVQHRYINSTIMLQMVVLPLLRNITLFYILIIWCVYDRLRRGLKASTFPKTNQQVIIFRLQKKKSKGCGKAWRRMLFLWFGSDLNQSRATFIFESGDSELWRSPEHLGHFVQLKTSNLTAYTFVMIVVHFKKYLTPFKITQCKCKTENQC